MSDTPYTTPDEDPFNVASPLLQPAQKRSSLLDKWIQELPLPPSVPPETSAVETYLGCLSPSFKSTDDVSTVHSYDLVQDEDIPSSPGHPVTPTRASKLLNRASSIRNFNLPFRSSSPARPNSPVNDSPRPSSRLSFLSKSSRAGTVLTPMSERNTLRPHDRSSSVTTLQAMPDTVSIRSSIMSTPSRWRPSVLGHFSTPSRSSEPSCPTPKDPPCTPPRPSMSSADTYTSGTGASDNDLGNFFTKLSLVDSFRTRGDVLKSRVGSTSSLWSQTQTTQTFVPSPTDSPQPGSSPPSISHWSRSSGTLRPYAPAFDEELHGIDEECEQSLPPIKPSKKPQIAYSSGGTLTRMRFPALTKRHKKRRLVVSGIKPNEVRKFENMKRWCENFGEVNQIMRMPNNDLHVHFREAEVADTVCRLNAKVFISGVGSVQLGWTYGNKRC